MTFKPRRRFVAISLSTALTSLLMLATPAAAGQAPANSTEAHSRTIDILGGNFLEVNESVTSTFRFKPGTVHVKQGDKLRLTNHSGEGHTFTLVSASLLPKTINDVFSCGGPGTICGEVGQAHFPMGFPQGPPSGCTPPACIQYVDNGLPSATPPALDTVNTLTQSGAADGDSVLIGPKTPPIWMTVTAPAGSVLPFMCVIHAWMQGKIVVDRAEGSD